MNNVLPCLMPALAVVAAAFSIGTASAQTGATKWPTHTVRLVVPFGAGGPADVVARTLAHKLAERWGQSIVIDNKPGANTTIGAADVIRAAPDGHTLFQAINSTLTVNQFTFAKPPYNVAGDFTPIALVATAPVVFVSNDTRPIKSLADLVRLAKAAPGQITIGGPTVGLQLAAERFMRDADIKLVYVPYKSGIDVTRGLLTGEINVGVDAVVANVPYIKNGKMHALATNNKRRIAALPEVPTLAELGYLNSEAGIWHAFVGPAKLPPDVRQRIQEDLRAVLEMPDVREKFAGLGLEPTWSSSEDLTKLVNAESSKLGPLIRDLGLKMD